MHLISETVEPARVDACLELLAAREIGFDGDIVNESASALQRGNQFGVEVAATATHAQDRVMIPRRKLFQQMVLDPSEHRRPFAGDGLVSPEDLAIFFPGQRRCKIGVVCACLHESHPVAVRVAVSRSRCIQTEQPPRKSLRFARKEVERSSATSTTTTASSPRQATAPEVPRTQLQGQQRGGRLSEPQGGVQITPCASMASATLTKPAMLAPST